MRLEGIESIEDIVHPADGLKECVQLDNTYTYNAPRHVLNHVFNNADFIILNSVLTNIFGETKVFVYV